MLAQFQSGYNTNHSRWHATVNSLKALNSFLEILFEVSRKTLCDHILHLGETCERCVIADSFHHHTSPEKVPVYLTSEVVKKDVSCRHIELGENWCVKSLSCKKRLNV